MVYGSTAGFLTLGVYTDLIARGLNLYTLLFCFITIQIAYVAGYTLFEVFGTIDDEVLY